jgi:hypothetical protein
MVASCKRRKDVQSDSDVDAPLIAAFAIFAAAKEKTAIAATSA